MSKVAFVDICGTLYDSNTTYDFLAEGAFNVKELSVQTRITNKLYRLLFNRDFIREKKLKKIAGKHRDILFKEMGSFYSSFLEKRKIAEVHHLINNLREQNFKIILVSATLDFIAEVVGGKIGANEVYSSTLGYTSEVTDGIIAKDLLGAKHLVAEKILSTQSDKVTDIVVITDNKSDLLLANMASKAYIIANDEEQPFWKQKLKTNFTFIKRQC